MAAVLLACASAALFGAMSVAVRFAFRQVDDAELGSLAMSSVALALTGVIGLVAARGSGLGEAWPFLIAGVIAPGVSQIFFVRAVRDAGAARTSVLMGTAPLVAVAIALTILREPVSAALLAGGASEVWSVDLSGPYLAQLDANLERSGLPLERHRALRRESRRVLSELAPEERFDGIVLDPP
ncbi:MAG TPA: EamA family transporter, partial [Gaiellaceae bacterium]|nr:EamA family transporter [Gaiellaceae bacterium]